MIVLANSTHNLTLAQDTGDEPTDRPVKVALPQDGDDRISLPTSDSGDDAENAGVLKPFVPGGVDDPQEGTPELQQMRGLAPGEQADLDPTGGATIDQPEQSDDSSTTGDGSSEREVTWRIAPVVGFGAAYDDNIAISNTNRQADTILSPSLGATAEFGDFLNKGDNYLIAQAAGTELIYLRHPELNALNQLASVEGRYGFSNIVSQLYSQYQYLTTPDRDVGTLTKRAIIGTSLDFDYIYSDKTSFDLALKQDDYLYLDYLSSYNYAVDLSGQYLLTAKLALGLEGVVGLLAAELSPLQYYQQLRLLAVYQATGKLTFKASGGAELRELDGGGENRFDPVFSLSGQYQLFANTTVDLEGYRRVQASAGLPGQDYVSTGFELRIGQKVFQKVTVSLSLGAEEDRYFNVGASSALTRRDQYLYAQPQISAILFKNYQISFSYEFRRNDSNQTVNSFYDNRAEVALTTQF